jgi:ribosome-binding protein aMBF1 (putative translation factor)
MIEILSQVAENAHPVAGRVDIPDLLRRMITGRQIRMARAALDWSAAELASRSGVSASSIQRAEAVDGVPTMKSTNLFKLQRALEIGGVMFVDADETAGEGVRLRRRL